MSMGAEPQMTVKLRGFFASFLLGAFASASADVFDAGWFQISLPDSFYIESNGESVIVAGPRHGGPYDLPHLNVQYVELSTLASGQAEMVGEAFDDVAGFQPDGGANPLEAWCKAHNLPVARHYGPGNVIESVY